MPESHTSGQPVNPGQLQDDADSQLAAALAASQQENRDAPLLLPGLDDMSNIDIIRAEEAKKPYIGDKETLEGLREEYASGSSVFVAKIDELAKSYGAMRRTRGDGNCFFRSFMFAYLEQLIAGGDTPEALRFNEVLQGWRSKLVQAGFQELVFEDALDALIQQVNAIIAAGPEQMTVAGLESNMRDDTISNTLVMFMRMVTSAEIQLRSDHFAPFILGMSDEEMSVEVFCRRSVEPMGEESDHIQAVALCDAVGVPIRVMYLDSNVHGGGGGGLGGGPEANSHDFVPANAGGAGGGGSSSVKVHILYRPGHYDILYPL